MTHFATAASAVPPTSRAQVSATTALSIANDVPLEPPTVTLLRAALAGEFPDDDVLSGVLASVDAGVRVAFLAELQELARGNAPDSGAKLDRVQREHLGTLRTRIAGLPPRLVRALEANGRTHPRLGALLTTALDIVTYVGDEQDVPTAILAADRWGADSGPRIDARPRELTATLAALIGRDARACAALRRAYRETPSALRPSVIDALGALPSRESADALLGCLGVHPGNDGQILNRLQGVTNRVPLTFDTVDSNLIRGHLDSRDPFLRTQAALVLGQVDDVEATPELIEALEDSVRSVREAGHASLRRLTAMTMGQDARRWRMWYAEQRHWWENNSAERLAALRSSNLSVLVPALNEISMMRLHRNELAPLVGELLQSANEPAVLALGCAAVESLRARSLLPVVATLLDDRDPGVQQRAYRTLRVVSGLDLPPTAAVWQRRLQ